jgi:hypothetical protein
MKKLVTILLTVMLVFIMDKTCYARVVGFLDADHDTLEVGMSQEIFITGSKEYIYYQSNNTDIATVSKQGIITAVSPGPATIHVTVKKLLEDKTLVIETIYLLNITVVEKLDMQIENTKIVTMSDNTIDIYFDDQDAKNVKLSYIVKDPDVVSLSFGDAKANKIPLNLTKGKPGSTIITITATYEDGKTETKDIAVTILKEIKNFIYNPFC